MAGQIARRRVNLFLAGFLVVLAIDASHPTGCNQPLKDALNLPLLVTGLWQGPWRLYGPDVPRDNLRFKVELVFADRATASWASPDWTEVPAPQKFVRARHMNYFNYLLTGGEPGWRGLCAYLARTVLHPQGRPVAVVEVTLSVRGARVPPPSERRVPAGPYLAFDRWEPIWVWRPGA